MFNFNNILCIQARKLVNLKNVLTVYTPPRKGINLSMKTCSSVGGLKVAVTSLLFLSECTLYEGVLRVCQYRLIDIG